MSGVDPKAEAGSKKVSMYLLPPEAKRACAKVLELGANKYGRYNWRTSGGVCATTYISAIMRHIDQYLEGEDQDEESGESHVAHIMATCCVLLDAMHHGKLEDDRPILGG